MAFDQPTRNRLQKFVTDARILLSDEFTRQMQHEYGLNPTTGEVADLSKLTQLSDGKRQTARLLRETMQHYQATNPGSDRRAILERIVREQAFTVLNRLCALRMAEANRDDKPALLIESIGQGYQSKGFQLYSRLAGTALGETGDAYRCYLFSLFDEFAVDLPVLFDRFSPSGRLFPRESVLLPLLEHINHPEIDALWAEDETIGWIYQYFNDPAERKKMRDVKQGGSAAPRNSRELAVRNQFFTPRYVVEFLADNTLGRIWYEMTQGQTSLKETCRYMIRRPDEVFLSERTDPNAESAYEECVRLANLLQGGAADNWPEFDDSEKSKEALIAMHMCVDGNLRPKDYWELCERVLIPQQYREISTQDLFDAVYFQGRADRHSGDDDTVYEQPWFIGACNELRRRALESRRPDQSQEQLLNQVVFIPHRPLKDPREIRMLDPACGSMHFGLYAFDLFERIYAEAWELEDEDKCTRFHRSEGLQPLRETYAAHEDFLRDIPRLIIEHNIHGIDIDPRAVQIAGLSLWLRAHKSWQSQGTRPLQRPQIRRSNIACAEPMPGEATFLEEFIMQHLSGDPERQFLAGLVRKVFDSMKLAGELGALLKIEEEIADEVARAKRQWLERPAFKQRVLFAAAPKLEQRTIDLTQGITDALFWDGAEELLYVALRTYSEQADQGGGYQRRLFADDVSRGFSFIDLCRKRFDVIVMNPPFGLMSAVAYRYLVDAFPFAYSDAALSFMARGVAWLESRGQLGAITSRAFLNVADAEKFRREMAASHLHILADLGDGVMDDAFVDASAQILSQDVATDVWIKDARKAEDKALALTDFRINDSLTPTYLFPLDKFTAIPRCRFAYDSGDGLRELLTTTNAIEPVYGIARTGASTFEDERFLRLVWEIPPVELGHASKWCWIARTTPEFCQFYYPYEIASKWNGNGAELSERNRQVNDQIAQARQGSTHYFKPGIVFSRRSRPSIAFRVHPSNCVFSSTCGIVFLQNLPDAFFILGVLNSKYVRAAIHTLTTYSYTVGHIRAIVAPTASEQLRNTVTALAMQLFRAKQETFRFCETDHFFVPQPIRDVANVRRHFDQHLEHLSALALQMQADSRELDSAVASIYRIEGELDTKRFGIVANNIELPKRLTERTLQDLAESHISEALGFAFGRWDIRYATGEKVLATLPDPFAPLPACPSGQLQGSKGLPAEPKDVPTSYPVNIPWSGILVDDPSHPHDIEGCVRAVFEIIWRGAASKSEGGGLASEAVELETCEILKVSSLRDYFRKPTGFFADHLKLYSRNRRQAPIYWPLSTSSGSYTLWVYYHRLTEQSLFTAINDFVEPKLKRIAADTARLRQSTARKSGDVKELEQLIDFEQELKDFRDELLRLAQFWKPNLNDGVQITAAPLWKLFRLPKWQKTLKETWQELEAGVYDWAHLAYSIWPDRVAEKCKTDKSFAIAHNLEHLYVELPKAAKKRALKKRKNEDEVEDADE